MQNYVANADANVLCGFMKIKMYRRDMTYENNNIKIILMIIKHTYWNKLKYYLLNDLKSTERS